MLVTAALALMGCGCHGAPDWPSNGEADEEWVEAALEWRLQTGIDRCGETGKAVDALTLEWIAESTEIVVRIESQDWAFLKYDAALKTPLIQALALAQMRGEECTRDSIHRIIRKVVKRSSMLQYRRAKAHFKHAPTRTW